MFAKITGVQSSMQKIQSLNLADNEKSELAELLQANVSSQIKILAHFDSNSIISSSSSSTQKQSQQ